MTTIKKTDTSWSESPTSNKLVKLLASCFGLGYLPKIPATYASLVGILLFFIFKDMNPIIQLMLLFFATVMAIAISERSESIEHRRSPEHVVIDAPIGMWVSLFLIWEINLTTILIAFVFFRFLDIIKPFPINLFQTFRGGAGILADDLAAGMITNIILRIILLHS